MAGAVNDVALSDQLRGDAVGRVAVGEVDALDLRCDQRRARRWRRGSCAHLLNQIGGGAGMLGQALAPAVRRHQEVGDRLFGLGCFQRAQPADDPGDRRDQ